MRWVTVWPLAGLIDVLAAARGPVDRTVEIVVIVPFDLRFREVIDQAGRDASDSRLWGDSDALHAPVVIPHEAHRRASSSAGRTTCS